MQIVIDVPIDTHYHTKKRNVSESDIKIILEAISKGTPFPKGHGELIDRDKIEYLKAIHDAKYGHISWIDAIEKIKHSAPTIIEADKKGDIYAD